MTTTCKRTGMDLELPEPLKYLSSGESDLLNNETITREFNSYKCSCRSWESQKGTPYNSRTCEHLNEYLGDVYELARLSWAAALLAQVPDEIRKTTSRPKTISKVVFPVPVKHKEPLLLLAQKFSETVNVEGYWVSEKIDGIRAYYDNELCVIVSRLGNQFPCPDWFIKGFPKTFSLDGELFLGRQKFQETMPIIKDPHSPLWSKITFQVFDSPSMVELFEERRNSIAEYFSTNDAPTVVVVKHTQITSKDDLYASLAEFEALGGEGVMLRKPRSMYMGKRSATLLKLKSFYDADAIVEEHIAGKGKYAGMLGALQCVMANGLIFKIGTGFHDSTRINPPVIGSVISYRFEELSSEGRPVFPAFLGERPDLTCAKDAVINTRAQADDDDA